MKALILLLALGLFLVGCVCIPDEPPEEKEPITTEVEAKAFLLEEGFPCEYDLQLAMKNTPDEYGYYGNPSRSGGEIVGYYDISTCRDEHFTVFEVYFDPNSHWIRYSYCNEEYITNCSENVDRPKEENPLYETYLELI